MLLTRRELPVVIVNLVYIPLFTVIALRDLNVEFLLYVAVILFLAALIVWKQSTVRFELPVLWGLTIWGIMHMAGGNLYPGGHKLYGLNIVSLVPSLHILRYDQVVHTFGFGVATLVCHHLLKPYLRDNIQRWGALSFLIVLMGSGFGAINEIIEFAVVLILPETGVGGYNNTMLDLVFNLIGCILAVIWINRRRRLTTPSPTAV